MQESVAKPQQASVFISHSTEDKDFINSLRIALAGQDIHVWQDNRELRGGDELTPEIKQAIAQSAYVLVVFTPNSINSEYVLNEIDWAIEQNKKLIPLCLPGVKHPLVKRITGKDALIIELADTYPGNLTLIMPQLLAALGKAAPTDSATFIQVPEKPLTELILRLRNPHTVAEDGARRFCAEAELIYHPADPQQRETRSKPFHFQAPLGAIETGELAWYLEHYPLWPVGVFKERGEAIEQQLPTWGKALHAAVFGTESARSIGAAWQRESHSDKRFSVEVDSDLPEGSAEEASASAQETATELLALPWELLHNERGYLFQGGEPARVRRRLPNREAQSEPPLIQPPLRILLVSPRPEQDGVGYIDHRVSAKPLVKAVAALGELVELAVLSPPTFPAMQQALKQAREQGTPFHVLHFDGHGVYDRRRGLGALCFEDPADSAQLDKRRNALVYANQLAAELHAHRIPLVFLEACQTAQGEATIDASVAGSLLQQGVTSVVAMSHSVLVETAWRFVSAFYARLTAGARVGEAMLHAQRALHNNPVRGRIPGAGELRMQDWFVPVLYQEQRDPQLCQRLLPDNARPLLAKAARTRLGELPKPPKHQFVGRSRELLALERHLAQQPYLVLRGQGGAGKTTLACELARWLADTQRFARIAFVSLEIHQNRETVLDQIGRQLLPNGDNWSVAEQSWDNSLQLVQRALAEQTTLLLLDNCESLLGDSLGAAATPFAPIAALAQDLQQAAPHSRLLFTAREVLPAPFNQHTLNLGPLSRNDALQLLAQVLEQQGLPLPAPAAKERDQAERELSQLADSLNHHARALVLLAPELHRRGLREVTQAAQDILAELDKAHPGDRENSLYASIELSLRRLPPELYKLCPGLAVFRGGAQLTILAMVLEVDEDTARALAIALIQVGLAEDAGYGHLRLDPALPAYLASKTPPDADSQQRYLTATQQLLDFLYQQIFKDTQTAFQLTLLELPNLLALLRQRAAALAQGDYPAAQMIELTGKLETLLARLGRPQALAEAVALREQAAQALEQAGEQWTRAHFLHASGQIDRLFEQGALPQALQAAQELLEHCQQAGEAYAEADYDTAYVYWQLGRVLKKGGAAQAALAPLQSAQQRFEALGENGARMASVCLAEIGDCLTNLGRLEAAAQAYQEAITRSEKLDDQRQVAVGKIQLGYVYLLQRNYEQALTAYQAARETFNQLGETGSVATAWHQTGIVYRQMHEWAAAEQAYRQSMQLKSQQGNRAGEATSLNELGNLYSAQGRLEEAVNFYRQAADIYVGLGDKAGEGRVRNNVADKLIKLQRYAEARPEVLRGIECLKEFGHAGEPWKFWMILHNLEQAEGQPQAAAEAKAEAVQAYLAYRRDGGENQMNPNATRFCTFVLQALVQGETTAIQQQLQATTQQLTEMTAEQRAALGEESAVCSLELLITKLQAILSSDRNPALAEDPALYYYDAAELLLLLEQLG